MQQWGLTADGVLKLSSPPAEELAFGRGWFVVAAVKQAAEVLKSEFSLANFSRLASFVLEELGGEVNVGSEAQKTAREACTLLLETKLPDLSTEELRELNRMALHEPRCDGLAVLTRPYHTILAESSPHLDKAHLDIALEILTVDDVWEPHLTDLALAAPSLSALQAIHGALWNECPTASHTMCQYTGAFNILISMGGVAFATTHLQSKIQRIFEGAPTFADFTDLITDNPLCFIDFPGWEDLMEQLRGPVVTDLRKHPRVTDARFNDLQRAELAGIVGMSTIRKDGGLVELTALGYETTRDRLNKKWNLDVPAVEELTTVVPVDFDAPLRCFCTAKTIRRKGWASSRS